LVACSKNNNPTPQPYYPDLTPFILSLEITKNNKPLDDSILKSIKVSYYAFGSKNYLVDFAFGKIKADTTKSIVGTYEAYLLSSTSNRSDSLSFPSIPGDFTKNMIHVNVPSTPVTDYYIEYPNGLKTDTMHLVTNIQNGEQAVSSPCYCSNPPPQVLMFNNINAVLDTALTLKAGGCINCYANIYLLKK